MCFNKTTRQNFPSRDDAREEVPSRNDVLAENPTRLHNRRTLICELISKNTRLSLSTERLVSYVESVAISGFSTFTDLECRHIHVRYRINVANVLSRICPDIYMQTVLISGNPNIE